MALDPTTKQLTNGAGVVSARAGARPWVERLADHVPLFSLIALGIAFSIASDTLDRKSVV